MAITCLQTVQVTSTTPTISATTAGSLLVLVGRGLATVSDGSNGSWGQDKNQTNSSSGPATAFSLPNSAAGVTSLTIGFAGSAVATFYEFAGAAISSAVDVSDSDEDDTTSAPNAAVSPGLTIAAGSVAVFYYRFDRGPSPSGPSGYTTLLDGDTFGYAGYQIFASGASNERAAIASDPTHYAAVLVAYKVGASVSGSSGRPRSNAFMFGASF